ncbi:MAG: hypothetical protein K9H25_01120 [Rhodospirillum sp.]|nr:hypothetical protein [Rhodospirillum sp.]MCF8488046.1 hypothetical protein [Rhodospirillum sp.]MCF8501530.1 hypothetical protein [Rhodospirillum sp.]
MELVTLIGITVAIALVIILVGALVNYMSSLVKSAYQIKVELRNDMETALKDMQSDIDKRAKWLKRDMVEETNKVREGMETANAKKIEEIKVTLTAIASEAREAGRADMTALAEGVAALVVRVEILEQEGKARKDMARRVRDKKEAVGESQSRGSDSTVGIDMGLATLEPQPTVGDKASPDHK